jgi:hypothetical protein
MATNLMLTIYCAMMLIAPRQTGAHVVRSWANAPLWSVARLAAILLRERRTVCIAELSPVWQQMPKLAAKVDNSASITIVGTRLGKDLNGKTTLH